MCEPTLIAYVATAVSGVGAYQASANSRAAARYQSDVAANNSVVAEWQAADAQERGDRAAADMRRRYAALMGTQRASLAARGLDISDGSANAILQDTAYFGEYDESLTRASAAREAWGYRVQASNFRGDAAALQAQADAENPLLAAGMAGAGTLMSGGVNSIAARWYQQGRGS